MRYEMPKRERKVHHPLAASCLGALACAEAQSHSRGAVNSELQRAPERVHQICSASADNGVPNHVLRAAKYVP